MALAVAIVAALAAFCILLFRPYLQNWRFQNYLEQKAFDTATAAQTDVMVRTDVLDQAARLGLPVSGDQVRVVKSATATYIEVRYFVRVDMPLYTVDLHFRPGAGVR